MFTLFCSNDYVTFCRLFEVEEINECSKALEFLNIRIERPAIIIICFLCCLIGIDLAWSVHSSLSKYINGKWDFFVAFATYSVWNLFVILDRSFFTDYSEANYVIILIETYLTCVLSMTLVNAGMVDLHIKYLSIIPMMIRHIIISIITIVIGALLLIGYFTSNILFEIVWVLGTFVPLGIFIILINISLIFSTKRLFPLALLLLSVGIFTVGTILYLFLNKEMCSILSPYFASEEIMMICIGISFWLFFKFFKRMKEGEMEGKKIGEVMIGKELIDVQLQQVN